ncbi:MAG: YbaB/EbfC family nucleoid-associated protein [Actinomycetota bacterium]
MAKGGGKPPMGGGMGGLDMNKMMKQVAKMQQDLAKADEELADEQVTGTAGNGLVTVTATGKGHFTGVSIKPEAIDPDDPSLLEDLVLAAFNDAKTAQEVLAGKRFGALGGGLGLPGMPGLPGMGL